MNRQKRVLELTAIVLVAGLAVSCVNKPAPGPPPLFDGKTLDNWSLANGDPVTKGWNVVDGVIFLDRSQGKAGHILSKEEYGDFDLSFDWKISEAGNSGLKYRVRKYGNSPLGCEYQVLDDAKAKGGDSPIHSSGSLYALYEPNAKKVLNPVGEYNSARIVVKGDKIEHWLNGEKIVEVTVGDAEWKRRVAASKFAKNEGFGANRLGKIMLTDHGNDVWYKNLKLTPLD